MDGADQTPAPGWYPDPNGQPVQRWWDGTQWTEQTSGGAPAAGLDVSSDTGMAQLVHILGLLTGFLGPLIIWLVKGDQSPFVTQHAKEALNFQIAVAIAGTVSAILIVVFFIGVVLLPLVFIADLIFCIQQTMAAGRGEASRYPVSIRLIS